MTSCGQSKPNVFVLVGAAGRHWGLPQCCYGGKKDSGEKGKAAHAGGETFSESYEFSGMRDNCSKMLAEDYRW